MPQGNKNIPTINLESIGGGRVRVDELTNATRSIINEFRKLNGKEPLDIPENNSTAPKPSSINWAAVRKYGGYGLGVLTAVYLIGKALE